MSRFLLAWEIGAGYWHLAQLLPLADELRRRGHEPVLAVRDLNSATLVYAGRDYPILQAPAWMGPRPSGAAFTYPALIAQCGYQQPDGLHALLEGWRTLLALVRPDFLVAEYAPTAVLAAKTLALPCAAVGASFFCPPRTVPMPVLPGRTLDPQEQRRQEEQVLGNVNAALARCGARPLEVLAEMFPAVGDVLTTFPELDHYGPRHGEAYCGPLAGSFGTARPAWPAGDGPRVLAYLDRGAASYAKLIDDLGRLGLPTLVHARGAAAAGEGTARSNLAFTEPVDLDHCLAEASIVVCHASHGMVARSLLHAVPLVLLPLHLEHAATRDRVLALGAGVAPPPAQRRDPAFDHAALVEAALQDPAVAGAAAAFAEAYDGFDPAAAARGVIDVYELVLADAR